MTTAAHREDQARAVRSIHRALLFNKEGWTPERLSEVLSLARLATGKALVDVDYIERRLDGMGLLQLPPGALEGWTS